MRDKKVITILLLSFVFLLILTISYSYSVFNSQITGEEDSKVAVWDIKINESLITGGTQAETHTFDINNMTMNDVSSIREGTFGPGSTVNFYLRFYPLDTDVSIKYVITVDPDIFGNDNIVISDARKTSANGTITKDGDTYTGIMMYDPHRSSNYYEEVSFSITWTDDEANNAVDTEIGETVDTFDIPVTVEVTQYLGE
jgi:hypothetical protein